MNIWIIDDSESVADLWRSAILSAATGVDVRVPPHDQLAEALEGLDARRAAARRKEPSDSELSIDSVDVLVMDYDLLGAFDGRDIAGAEIAYLARCYSQVGFIVVVNQFGENHFDVREPANLENFADLHVGGQQLGNPGLWSPTFVGYRPWCWPVIPEACQRLRNSVNRIMTRLDTPILPDLGLDRYDQSFTKSLAVFLSYDPQRELGKEADRTTPSLLEVSYRDFVQSSVGGLRRKDRLLDDAAIARVAASRLGAWLNRQLLPRQDVLVDAPHLAFRLPSIVGGVDASIDDWNRTCVVYSAKQGSDVIFPKADLRQHVATVHDMAWRPVWFWPSVQTDSSIAEIASPWETEEPAVRFCEDVSQFVPEDSAQTYLIQADSVFRRRYVLSVNSDFGRAFVQRLPPGAMNPEDVFYHPASEIRDPE